MSANPLDYRFTDQLASTAGLNLCRVFQGNEITLVSCPTSFEIYKTQDLALEPYALQNDGENIGIRCARKSLETFQTGRLTYCQQGNVIKTVYYDPIFGQGFNKIVKMSLISIIIPKNFFLQDAWVFDSIVATRLTNNTFAFYQKPLVAGNIQDKLIFDQTAGGINPNATEYEMQNGALPNSYFLFAIAQGVIYRYDLVFDQV